MKTTVFDLPTIPLICEELSSRYLRKHLLVPLQLTDRRLILAAPEEADADAIRRALLPAINESSEIWYIEVVSMPASILSEYLEKIYAQESASIDSIVQAIDEPDQNNADDVGHLKDIASEAPIINLMDTIIRQAISGRSSDIHVEPFIVDVRVRYRIDGVLHDVERLPKRLHAALLSRIKIMAKLNIAERRLPQDGVMRVIHDGEQIDLRLSTVPTLHGESAVIRILKKEQHHADIQTLGMPDEGQKRFEQLIREPNGIILITGPTGSGKTTTLYGALNILNNPDKKIITVEDPIEYDMPGIMQIPVKPQIDFTFSKALRHVVRQDPDIIMVGEIRDRETAEIAVQAALTGHLVFSTLHTNDAASTITRLADMGIEHYLLASTLIGVIAQRLVRILCGTCRGDGCEACTFTGYRGRTGIFEILTIDRTVQNLIGRGADNNTIKDAARAAGMKTLLEDGMRKAATGITTENEVLRVAHEDLV